MQKIITLMVRNLFLTVFVIFVATVISHSHHECIHDKIVENYTPGMEPHVEGRMLLNGIEDVKKPLRVFFDSSALNDTVGTFEQRDYITNNLLPLAKNFFETRISIKRRTSPIKMFTYSNTCFRADVPEKYRTIGIDTDLLIFVTAGYFNDSYTAWASSCMVDTVNLRPLAGQINFNLNFLGLKPEEFEANIGTTLHELTHVLGFSAFGFLNFIDPETGKRRLNTTIVKKAVKRGFNTTLLITPKVLELARNHYGCPTLEGVEVENQGGSGSLGSHFERAVLMNEAMTASRIQNRAYSKFTLAVLEDSGWYYPNYNLSDEFFFGQDAGCEMVNNACLAEPKPREYCYETIGYFCTLDYYSKGFCSSEGFSDNCRYIIGFGNGDCRIEANIATNSNITITGEIFSPESKCVRGTLKISNTRATTTESSKCVQYSCASGLVQLKVNSGEILTCNEDGQKVTAAGYSGYLICPPKKLFCETYYEACPNYCSGRGKCIEGKCMCTAGRTGPDCSLLAN